MRTTRLIAAVLTSLALVASASAVVGCGGKNSKAKTAAVKPGNLPSGATWEGVYYNPVWGYLHMETDGSKIKGRWKRADESAWGELEGTITGDVCRFEWSEHKIGLVGPSATTKGRGYFRYTRPKGDNMDDRILGEWGFEDAEVGGGEWDAIEQRNMKPDLKSVGGDAESGIGDWK